ncbi:MAG: phytanoyl-CoA dioxygenase family protein [Pseudomonadales bacterium]|nr:phytanoyl-CoA dioxygenase family protein [Pseudomonadales bacterium]MBO6564589.1 phytanoyl-CoA dioxygenase family protein [Pseudomonadales bacterium]MBO6596879.1 phytanoyl-CoA dioxygenase family protein [Pseudomonadales bacterium]MBO6658428.1 phytanoyl-CoA dioxygenase family protein [Pseudomonadales bacterium]MBO6703550.1 phytanoyl-CoA dioxygenase family protein [Pseudomonadales bacterium]
MQQQYSLDHSLSEEELFSYRQHGYVIRPDVFSGEELQKLRNIVESAAARAHRETSTGKTYFLDGKRFVDVGHMTVQYEHEDNSDTIRVIEPVQHLHEGLRALVFDERIVHPIKSILETDSVSIWTNKLNLKRGKAGSGFGWHQDSPYWVHDSDHVDLLPNVYLAFDDATRENGCLRVIDKSHLEGCLPGTGDGSQLGGFFTDPNCFNEGDEVLMEASAGSLVFFDPHSIHGSGPNETDQSRRAIVMTYQPAGFPMLKTGEVCNVP